MTRLTDEELRQEIQDIVKARRIKEQSFTSPYEDSGEFGRRVAVKLFEKYVKGVDGQESSKDETD